MKRQIKDKWLGTRVDGPYLLRVRSYADGAGLDVSDLVRDSVDEYMSNHPLKDEATRVNASKITKPGE